MPMTMPLRTLLTLIILAAALAGPARTTPAEHPIGIGFEKGEVVLRLPEKVGLLREPTAVVLVQGPGSLEFGPLPLPSGENRQLEPVYHGTVRIPVRGRGLRGPVTLAVHCQACPEGGDGPCFPANWIHLTVDAAEIPALDIPPRASIAVGGSSRSGAVRAAYLQELAAPVARAWGKAHPGLGETFGEGLMKAAWMGDFLLGRMDFWEVALGVVGFCLLVRFALSKAAHGAIRQHGR